MLLTTIFYQVDDFCNEIEKHLLNEAKKARRGRPKNMLLSEILTIAIFFHHSKMKTFKDYYTVYIQGINRSAFTNIVSYNRIVELIEENMAYLAFFALAQNASATGIGFIDSTTIAVCHNKRIHCHKVLMGLAKRGKSSMGWFFGFKLHFVINHYGEIVGFTITPGDVDDRDPSVISIVTKNLLGKLFGDRGYISQKLFEELFEKGVHKNNFINMLKIHLHTATMSNLYVCAQKKHH